MKLEKSNVVFQNIKKSISDIHNILLDLFSLTQNQLTLLSKIEENIQKPYNDVICYLDSYGQAFYPKCTSYIHFAHNKSKEDITKGIQQAKLGLQDLPIIYKKLSHDGIFQFQKHSLYPHTKEVIINGSRMGIILLLGHSGGFFGKEYIIRPGAGLTYMGLVGRKNNPLLLSFTEYDKRKNLSHGPSQPSPPQAMDVSNEQK